MNKTLAHTIAFTKVPLGRKQYLPSIMICVAVFAGALYQLRTSSISLLPFLYLLFSFAFVYLSLRRLSDTGLSGWWSIAPPLFIVCWIALIVRFAISPSVPFLARVSLIAIPLLAAFITLAMVLIPGKRSKNTTS